MMVSLPTHASLGLNELSLYQSSVAGAKYTYMLYNWVIISSGKGLGAVSIRKTVFPGMAIPMLKIRRPSGRLIFNMEIAIRR